MNTADTERTVELRVLFFRILKRWRFLLLFLLLGLIAGAVFKYVRGGTKTETVTESVPALKVPMTEEEYARAVSDYERNKAQYEDAVQIAQADYDTYMAYWDGSILAKIDPYNAPSANARLVVSAAVSDETAPNAPDVLSNGMRYIIYTLDSRLKDPEVYEKISQLTGQEVRYLQEVIKYSASSGDSLIITVYYTDTETAEKILDLILREAETASKDIRPEGIASYTVEAFMGFIGVTVSPDLRSSYNSLSQSRVTMRTTLDKAKAQLSALVYPEAYKTVKAESAVSKDVTVRRRARIREIAQYSILFGAVFFLIGAVLAALRVLFPYKILSSSDMEQCTGLPVFADYGSLTPKHKTRFDKWILKKLEGKTSGLDTDGHSGVVRVASEKMLQGSGELTLLSTSEEEAVETIAESLRKALPDVKIGVLKGVLNDPEKFGGIADDASVFLLEKLEKSTRSGIVSEMNYLKNRGADVKGCIVFE